MTGSNSSLPIVRPGVANGFLSNPQVNPPAGANKATSSPGLKTPRGLITSRPQTGARRERTRFGGAGNPGGNNGVDSSNDQCSVSKEQKSQEPSTHHTDLTKKKKKRKRNSHLDKQV